MKNVRKKRWKSGGKRVEKGWNEAIAAAPTSSTPPASCGFRPLAPEPLGHIETPSFEVFSAENDGKPHGKHMKIMGKLREINARHWKTRGKKNGRFRGGTMLKRVKNR